MPRVLLTLCGAVVCSATLFAQASSTAWLDPYRPVAARILTESQATDFAWKRLAELSDTFGNRLSGSETLEKAIDWAVSEMKKDGLQNVHKEPAMVPRWIRGHESLDLVDPVRQPLVLLGLGNSIGTPPKGIEAEVVVVKNYDEMAAKANEIKGRILLLNVPFTNYGETRPYRSDGPSKAAKLGAVAFLLRSVGPPGLRTPHTGAMNYTTDAPKIPAAAIPTEDADRLQRLADRGVKTRVKLMMEAHFENDAQSYNVVGEIVGKDLPKEVLVVGGHIDSWDVGAGATDDGGGCVVTWEALRLIHKLDLHPRRTIRVVLFTNEENGTRGGNAYRDRHMAELPSHVLLLESDGGVFDPAGFGVTFDPAKSQPPAVSERARQTVATIASLLSSIGADHVTDGGEGTDIEPASTAGNVPMLSHLDTGDYFLIHHTPADTIARITPAQVSKNAAAIAVMIYTLADLPWRLGHE